MDIQERVDELEKRLKKQSRRLAWYAFFFTIIVGVLMGDYIIRQTGRMPLRGKRVFLSEEMVGRDKRVIMTTSIDPIGGYSSYVLHYPADRKQPGSPDIGAQAKLNATPNDAYLTLTDRHRNGSPKIRLFARKNQTGLLIRDDNGAERAKLVVTSDGPKLVLLDEDGQILFSAP